ncbi:hypothetical protein BDR03DRAFT_973776 [Suillus americanus]|nr:hypothetical protein BDR03DRAFT_973776 [Suillus americanus]
MQHQFHIPHLCIAIPSTPLYLITLLQRHVPQHTYSNKDHPKPKKEHPCPDWVISLVHPHSDDPEGFRNPLCYLPAQMDLARIPYYPGVGVQTGPSYYKLFPSQTLQDLLQGTHFAEKIPTIHVRARARRQCY